jgi:hypothetical protein
VAERLTVTENETGSLVDPLLHADEMTEIRTNAATRMTID